MKAGCLPQLTLKRKRNVAEQLQGPSRSSLGGNKESFAASSVGQAATSRPFRAAEMKDIKTVKESFKGQCVGVIQRTQSNTNKSVATKSFLLYCK